MSDVKKKGKNRTERKGSSLLLLIRNDKGKKPKKKKKRKPFSSTIWSRMMERKTNVSSFASSVY
jgi:hypothetical protein